ncbi:MAG: mechanosensitive ion channel [Bacteroidales bacterium]|nr:mechanosensitive ion channel [Bacteroidales bacterium]
MNTLVNDWMDNWLTGLGMSQDITAFVKMFIFLIVAILLSYLSNIIVRKFIVSILTTIIKRSKTKIDDIFLERKVFNRLSHFAPALVIFFLAPLVFEDYPALIKFFRNGAYLYMIIIGSLVADSFINAMHEIYVSLPISKHRSIKGYVQVVKIAVYFIAIILIISTIFGESPKGLLTALGTAAAVLILVFKDTILGFIASIQLSANKMVKPGDWISMPAHNADGTVIEISLNTIKVQNWDKTITTVPTYALVSESFYNWKGMEESGGRRIKRSVIIDMKSIKFCTPEMIKKFKKIQILRDIIEKKEKELDEYNKKYEIDNSVLVNGRRMTNIGVFRAYIRAYLHNHPKINNEMTSMVRQLQPTDKGLPLQIYVFSNDKRWVEYEKIQSDIFDHILAVAPEFDLRVFQNPSGYDVVRLLDSLSDNLIK